MVRRHRVGVRHTERGMKHVHQMRNMCTGGSAAGRHMAMCMGTGQRRRFPSRVTVTCFWLYDRGESLMRVRECDLWDVYVIFVCIFRTRLPLRFPKMSKQQALFPSIVSSWILEVYFFGNKRFCCLCCGKPLASSCKMDKMCVFAKTVLCMPTFPLHVTFMALGCPLHVDLRHCSVQYNTLV